MKTALRKARAKTSLNASLNSLVNQLILMHPKALKTKVTATQAVTVRVGGERS
jgi:hypothetical protein